MAMADVRRFVEAYWGYAQQMEQDTNVPALVVLSQSALETGWGLHCPSNMMFGIKAGRTWRGKRQLLLTTEYHADDTHKYPEILSIEQVAPGRWKYRVRDWFRAYASPYDSFMDYAQLLRKFKRYRRAFEFVDDPDLFLIEIARAGYSTTMNYYDRVKACMEMIKVYV